MCGGEIIVENDSIGNVGEGISVEDDQEKITIEKHVGNCIDKRMECGKILIKGR